MRLREFALFVPTAQAVDFIAADFDVEVAHTDEARQRGDFVLSAEDDAGRAHGVDETKFLNFGKALGELEFSLAVDSRVRNGFVERNFGRPLRDGVVAFAALVKTDLDRSDFIEQIGGALYKKVGQTRSGAGVDDGGAVLFLEAFGVAELLGLKRISREMRTQVEIMRAKAKRSAQDDFVEDGCRSVDDELAALGGFDDAAQVASVYFGDGDNALPAQKAARANRVAVAAPDGVALTVEKLCEEGAGRPRSQNEDPHGVKETLPQEWVGLRSPPRRITIGVSKWTNPKRHCSGYGK